MIPLVSISNLITLPFLIVISFRLFLSFLGTKDKNIGYFFTAFALLTIMEGLVASPGLIFKNLIQIGTVFAIFPFFVFLGLGFWGAIPFSILKLKKVERIFLICLLLIAIFTTVINLNNVQSAVVYQYPPFIYWEDTRGTAMNIFIGLLSGLILLFIILFFFINGLKSNKRYVRVRSFLISGGVAGFFLASIINFVVGASHSTYKYMSSLTSALLLILSSIIIFAGIHYKNKKDSKEDSYPQIKKDYPKIQW